MGNSFYELTPDRVIKAVENLGFSVTGHYMVLNSYENRVYDLMLEDENHVIVKYYRPGRWSFEQIKEEHRFITDLERDEITVCIPLAASGGETVYNDNGIYFAIWPRTGGRIPDELSNVEMVSIGRLLGRIHNNGASGIAEKRLRLTGETYGLGPLSFLLSNGFIPTECQHRYREAVHEIVEVYESLSRDVPFHRIHGDCHAGNLLKRDELFFFLDFDDFLTGPAVQDIWMLLSTRGEDAQMEASLFLQGYREFRDFDESWLKLIEPLRGLRYIHYAGWIAKRWEDPSFRQIFPHFGTDDYWERETSDLADQVNIIFSSIRGDNSSSVSKKEPQVEEVLTNRDFFWDME